MDLKEIAEKVIADAAREAVNSIVRNEGYEFGRDGKLSALLTDKAKAMIEEPEMQELLRERVKHLIANYQAPPKPRPY